MRCNIATIPQQIRVKCHPQIREINAIRDDWLELMQITLHVTELLRSTLCSKPCVSI
jgi:hypothetical protein